MVSIRKRVASGFDLLFCTFSSFIKQQRALVQVFLPDLGNECLVKAVRPLIGWCFAGGQKAAANTETYC